MVVPSHSSPTCFSSGCMVGLNKTCPNKLMIYDGIIPIACSSACKESSTHENCWTNYFGSRQTWKATLYSQNFERACPLAYSYPYSDSNSTFTCPNTTNYVITFCPSSIPNTARSVQFPEMLFSHFFVFLFLLGTGDFCHISNCFMFHLFSSITISCGNWKINPSESALTKNQKKKHKNKEPSTPRHQIQSQVEIVWCARINLFLQQFFCWVPSRWKKPIGFSWW